MKNIIIGPGAMGFFMFLGFMARLKKDGHLEDLEELSGASAGALLGFLYCLSRGDPTRVLDYSLQVPVKSIMKPNIKSLTTNYGLVPTSKVRKVLSEACMHFIQKDNITFRELHDYFPVKLHVSSYCVDYMKTVYFSADTTPNESVLDAVCASIAIPFLFSSVKMGGANYIDGGAAETVPGAPFLGRQDVFSIRFAWGMPTKVRDLKTYAISILYATMNLRAKYDYEGVALDADPEIFDFGASNEGKLRMFLKGWAQNFS